MGPPRFLLLSLAISFAFPLFGEGEGLRIVHGDVGPLNSDGQGNFVLESSGNAIVEWDRFSIASHETFHFQQDLATSAILNRVLGGAVSEIAGLLTSNGTVFLINPGGILIQEGGRIQTASFVGSTLDLSNDHFLKGEGLLFGSGGGKGIEHRGEIVSSQGDVILVAPEVRHEGRIEGGRVLLLAQEAVWIDPGRRDLKEVVSRLKEGESPYAQAIGGSLFADGEIISSGGEVLILGDAIEVGGENFIDVSAPEGGGEIWIGGDFQGKSETLPHARRVSVKEGSQLLANATEEGDGGRVILWSDEQMVDFGKIEAKGGALGGNGGMAEVSGKKWLVAEGRADLRALKGKVGTLLLDPRNVTISGAATSNGTLSGCPGSTFTPSGDSAVLNVTSLTTNLATCNVTVQTSGGGGTQDGNLTISSAISWSASTTLTLTADSYIAFNASVSCSGNAFSAGAYALVATAGFATGGSPSGAALNIASGVSIDMSAGNGGISLTGDASAFSTGANQAIGVQFITSAFVKTSTGPITIVGKAGTNTNNFQIGIAFAGSLTNTFIRTTSGSVTLTGTGGSSATAGVGGMKGIDFYGNPAVNFTAADPSTTEFRMTGTGGTSVTGGNYGIGWQGLITVTSGTLKACVVTGTGGSGGTDNTGVFIIRQGPTTNTSGVNTLTINGTSGNGNSSCGVKLTNTINPAVIGSTSTTADISITGTCSTASASGLVGVLIQGGSTVQTGGSGTITIVGTGGANGTSGSSHGVQITGTGSAVQTSGNTLSVQGTASGTGNNVGVLLAVANALTSTSGQIVIPSSTSSATSATAGYGVSITAAQSIGTSNATALTITGTGAAGSHGINVGAGITSAGGTGTVTLTGTGGTGSTVGVAFGAGVTTAGGIVSIVGTSGVSTGVTVDTTNSGGTAAGANISFSGSINSLSGTPTLTLAAGTAGGITLSTVGDTAAMGLSFTSGATLSLGGNITLGTGSFAPSAGMATTITNSITINAGSGAITFPTTVVGTAPTASKALTLTTTGAVTLSGNVGTSGVNLGAFQVSSGASGLTINTNVTNIYAASYTVGGAVPTTLVNSAAVTIDTSGSNGAISLGSGAINGSVAGSQALTFVAGGGSITASSAAMGGTTRLGTVTVTSALNASFAAITASGFTQSAGTGTTTFGGNLNFNSGGMSLTGTAFTFNTGVTTTASAGNVSINNSSTFTLNSGANISVSSGTFAQSNSTGGCSLNATITSSGALSFAGPITLAGTTSLTSSGSTLTLSNTVNGAQSLTLSSSGLMTFSAAIGGSTPLSALSTTAGSYSIASNITTSGASGALSLNAPITLTGASTWTTTSAGITLGASGTVNGGFPFVLTTNTSGVISIGAAIGGSTPVTNFTATGAGGITLGGNVTTSGGAIQFVGASTLSSPGSTLTSAGGDISFSSTIDGGQPLTFVASGGSITCSGAIGGGTRLGSVTVTSALNASFPAITATSLTQSAGTGTTTFTGAVNLNTGNCSLTGTNFTFNSGANVTVSAGTFTEAGSGTMSLASSITASGAVSVGSAVSLAGTSALTSSGSTLTLSNTVDGGQNLSLSSSGLMTFGAAIGGTTRLTALSNTASSYSIASDIRTTTSEGTLDFNAPITLTGNSAWSNDLGASITLGSSGTVNGGFNFSVSGGAISLLGVIGGSTPVTSFTATSSSTTSLGANVTSSSGVISFQGATTVSQATTTLTTSGGNILFGSTLNGSVASTKALTLVAGAGSITASGVIGGTNRLGAVTISTAQNATFAALNATSFTQSAGTGTTTFGGALNLSTGNLSLTGTNFTFSAPSTITLGNVSVAPSGTLTMSSGANMTVHGSFTKSGTGNSSIAANITTTDADITFNQTTTFAGSSTLSVGGSLVPGPLLTGDVTLSGPVEGPGPLTIVGDTVTFSSTVGGATALGSLSVTGNSIVISGNQTMSGATSYIGPVSHTTGVTIINSGSGGMSFSSTIIGAHPLILNAPSTTITCSGAVTLDGGAGAAGSAFTASAGGTITCSGAISTKGGTGTTAGFAGGAVSLTSTGGSVSVQSIDTSGSTGTSTGGNGGNISLQPAITVTSGALGNIPNGQIILNGNLTASGGSSAGTAGTGGSVYLTPNDRTIYPSIATITSSFVGNDVTITAGSLVMGLNESMTILGNLSCTLTGNGTLTDIVTLGNLTISGSSVTAIGHGTEQILLSDGTLADITGGHILSGGTFSVSGLTAVGNVHSGPISGYTTSSLRAALIYTPSSYILNFDSSTTPVPTPVTPTFLFSSQQLVELSGVASISFEDLLPLLPGRDSWPYHGKVCPSGSKTCRLEPLRFYTFIFEGNVSDNPKPLKQ